MHRRLQRLEQKVPDPGCLACRDRRGRIVTVDCQRQRDGSITALEPMPGACEACGQIAEFIVEIVRPYEEGHRTPDEVFDRGQR
jgi:hypothetical protein